jgi:hypothetical protein
MYFKRPQTHRHGTMLNQCVINAAAGNGDSYIEENYPGED